MTDERTFEFEARKPNGDPITVSILDSYDSRMQQLKMDKWREENPRPEPHMTIDKLPWKNDEGFIEVVNYDEQNAGYLRALVVWRAKLNNFALGVMNSYVDQSSFDPEILEFALSLSGIEDPVEAYLFVITKGDNVDSGDDSATTEIQRFYNWVQEIGSTSEALIERYFAEFRRKNNGQSRGDENGVRVAEASGRKEEQA